MTTPTTSARELAKQLYQIKNSSYIPFMADAQALILDHTEQLQKRIEELEKALDEAKK